MKETKLDLFLKLEGEQISTGSFKKAIDNFFGFIEKLSIQLEEKTVSPQWIVSVEKGSICLKLHPEFPAPELIANIKTGVNQISQKDERPPYYSNEILTNLKALALLPKWKKSGIKGVYIITDDKEIEMSPSVCTNIISILKIQREEFGSFEGTLKIISAVQGLHFQIYEFVHNRAIKCLMDERLVQKALGAFNKRVSVYGIIKYSKGGIPGSIHVQDLRIFKDEEELPSANDVLGILKGFN